MGYGELTPRYFPGLTVYYAEISPGQRLTFNQPGFDPEFEFTEVYDGDHLLSDELAEYLISENADEWTNEIINKYQGAA